MLKKIHRLRTRYEFGKVRRFGNRYSNPLFNLYVLDVRDYSGPSKVGVVVTNKVDKSAVKRNRLKRVFREAIRLSFDKIHPGYWLACYIRKAALGKNYEEVSTEINKVLQKAFIPRQI